MFLFRRGSKANHKLPPSAHRRSFERIQSQWQESCESNDLELPEKVISEFAKRIKQSDSNQDCGKAKLNLSKCNLDDRMVICLVKVLAEAPMIAKLDLSGNQITDNSAACLIRLLIMQAKHVRETNPHDRFEAIYLAEVLLENNKSTIERRILEDIRTVTGALHHANLMNSILQLASRESPLTRESLSTICHKVLGRKIDKKKLDAAISKHINSGSFSADVLSAELLQELIIGEMVAEKTLPILTETQIKHIQAKPSIMKRNFRNSITDPDIDTTESSPYRVPTSDSKPDRSEKEYSEEDDYAEPKGVPNLSHLGLPGAPDSESKHHSPERDRRSSGSEVYQENALFAEHDYDLSPVGGRHAIMFDEEEEEEEENFYGEEHDEYEKDEPDDEDDRHEHDEYDDDNEEDMEEEKDEYNDENDREEYFEKVKYEAEEVSDRFQAPLSSEKQTVEGLTRLKESPNDDDRSIYSDEDRDEARRESFGSRSSCDRSISVDKYHNSDDDDICGFEQESVPLCNAGELRDSPHDCEVLMVSYESCDLEDLDDDDPNEGHDSSGDQATSSDSYSEDCDTEYSEVISQVNMEANSEHNAPPPPPNLEYPRILSSVSPSNKRATTDESYENDNESIPAAVELYRKKAADATSRDKVLKEEGKFLNWSDLRIPPYSGSPRTTTEGISSSSSMDPQSAVIKEYYEGDRSAEILYVDHSTEGEISPSHGYVSVGRRGSSAAASAVKGGQVVLQAHVTASNGTPDDSMKSVIDSDIPRADISTSIDMLPLSSGEATEDDECSTDTECAGHRSSEINMAAATVTTPSTLNIISISREPPCDGTNITKELSTGHRIEGREVPDSPSVPGPIGLGQALGNAPQHIGLEWMGEFSSAVPLKADSTPFPQLQRSPGAGSASSLRNPPCTAHTSTDSCSSSVIEGSRSIVHLDKFMPRGAQACTSQASTPPSARAFQSLVVAAMTAGAVRIKGGSRDFPALIIASSVVEEIQGVEISSCTETLDTLGFEEQEPLPTPPEIPAKLAASPPVTAASVDIEDGPGSFELRDDKVSLFRAQLNAKRNKTGPGSPRIMTPPRHPGRSSPLILTPPRHSEEDRSISSPAPSLGLSMASTPMSGADEPFLSSLLGMPLKAVLTLLSESIPTQPVRRASIFKGRDDDANLYYLSTTATASIDHIDDELAPAVVAISAYVMDVEHAVYPDVRSSETSSRYPHVHSPTVTTEMVCSEVEEASGTRTGGILRSRSENSTPMPAPRNKTPLPPGKVECTHSDDRVESELELERLAAKPLILIQSKVNILKPPRRSLGPTISAEDGAILGSERSPAVPESFTVPSYSDDDYSNYIIGDKADGGSPDEEFFADDNPLSHVAAKLEGPNRAGQFEFSGPLGHKIKESLQRNVPLESIEQYMNPSEYEGEKSEYCRSPSRPSESLSDLSDGVNPMVRPCRDEDPAPRSSLSVTVPLSARSDRDRLPSSSRSSYAAPTSSSRSKSVSSNSSYQAHGAPSPLSSSPAGVPQKGGFRTGTSPGVAAYPKRKIEQRSTFSSGKKAQAIPSKPPRLPGSGGQAPYRGSQQTPAPRPSRQLWTQTPAQVAKPLVHQAKKSMSQQSQQRQVKQGVVQSLEGERGRERGAVEGPAAADLGTREDAAKVQSATIYIPEDEKRRHSNRTQVSATPRESDRARNDFLLDLTNRHLKSFDASPSQHYLYPKNKLSLLCVLILRNNQLSDLRGMRLTEMWCLTDLDLAHNLFSGPLPSGVFPKKIERLDLGWNSFDNFSGLVTCTSLLSVNISHNRLKAIVALPSKLVDLDISYNLLSSPLHLRLLSLSPSIQTLRIAGNPIVEASAFCRVIVCSVLPCIQQLDDVFIPGCTVRRKNGPQGPGRGTPGKDPNDGAFTVSKAAQEKMDELRHGMHAKKMKEAQRVQDGVKQQIRTQAKTAVIGSQATELMVRRLTWVPPNKAVGASFFNEPSMPSSHSVCGLDDIYATPGPRPQSARSTRPQSARSTRSVSSTPCPRRSASKGTQSSERRRRSASPSSHRKESWDGRQSQTVPSRLKDDSFNSLNNLSRTSDNSSFSTFGASKQASLVRSTSAPISGRVGDFKPFSRHSELPPSPSRDKRDAVFLVNKWLHDSVQELGRASVVLGLAFWMSEQTSLESNSHVSYSAAMDRIPFLRELAPKHSVRGSSRERRATESGGKSSTVHMEDALGVISRGGTVPGTQDRDDYFYLLAAVEAAKGNMESFASVLRDIEKAIISANGPHNKHLLPLEVLGILRGQLEDIMCSTRGRIVNELVLTPFGCQLIWHPSGDENDVNPLSSQSLPLSLIIDGTDGVREVQDLNSVTSLGSTISTHNIISTIPIGMNTRSSVLGSKAVYTKEMLDKDTIHTINALNSGSYMDERSPQQIAPPRSEGRGRSSTASESAAARMDPIKNRLIKRLGIQGPTSSPKSQSGLTASATREEEQIKSPLTSSSSRSRGSSPIPPQPVPKSSAQKKYLSSFIASPQRTSNQKSPTSVTSSKGSPRRGTSSNITGSRPQDQASPVSRGSPNAGARDRDRGVSRGREVTNRGRDADREGVRQSRGADRDWGSDSGCSVEFLVGGKEGRITCADDSVIAAVKAALALAGVSVSEKPRVSGGGALAASASDRHARHQTSSSNSQSSWRDGPRVVLLETTDPAFLDYNDIYDNNEHVIEPTQAQAEEVLNYRKANGLNLRRDSISSRNTDGAQSVRKGDVEGDDSWMTRSMYFGERESAPAPYNSEICSMDSQHTRPEPSPSPPSEVITAKALPPAQPVPSFGFSNSYSAPAGPVGRIKFTKFLEHTSSDSREPRSAPSSIIMDDMFSAVSPRARGNSDDVSVAFTGPTAATGLGKVSGPGSGTPSGSLTGTSVTSSSRGFFKETTASNSSVSRVGSRRPSLTDAPVLEVSNISVGGSRSVPSTVMKPLIVASGSEESEFVSVTARRDSMNLMNKEIQSQKAAAVAPQGKGKFAAPPGRISAAPSPGKNAEPSSPRYIPGSIDIRGYNREAAMAVKARLSSPVKLRRKTIGGVSSELADRLRTYSDPAHVLGI